jgi:hypothetical protein
VVFLNPALISWQIPQIRRSQASVAFLHTYRRLEPYMPTV